MSHTAPKQTSGFLPGEWNNAVFRGMTRGRQLMLAGPPGGAPRAGAPRFAPPAEGEPIGDPVDVTPPVEALLPPKQIPYSAMKLVVSQEWVNVNERLNHVFDIAGFQPIMGAARTLTDKQAKYNFQKKGSDKYPPHLNHIPKEDEVGLLTIFNWLAFTETALILRGVWTSWTTPDPIYNVKTLDEIIVNDRKFRKAEREVFAEPNIGDRDDWYSDDVVAQQYFTGANPCTITSAPPESSWAKQFRAAAEAQKLQDVLALMDSNASALYVADYSYFRTAVGATPRAELSTSDNPRSIRYGCASVGLFNLTPEGKLHPLAIIIDYKENMESSVTIFNKCLTPGGNTLAEQHDDWPWRYAKTALGCADWLHHQIKVHLTDTHLIEECIIVATHRAFEETDPIYNLLEPHWERTLSLNKAARDTLVPSVVSKVVGIREADVYKYINYVYANFDWVGGYIPNDLKARGFPDGDELDAPAGRYHNYAYARNMKEMWQRLRNFVENYLNAVPQYKTDKAVAESQAIQFWCDEIKSPLRGGISSFPNIKTRDELIDALTMCIHIASPQHTAINYLQRYYMALVINKPPCLCKPLPQDLPTLQGYKQQDLFNALPVTKDRAQVYMSSSHLPWLLSYQVAAQQNLTNYAISLKNLNQGGIKDAAVQLEKDLGELKVIFDNHNAQLDDKQLDYSVMDPELTAVSILI